jgi:hypothetical protein
VWLWWWPPSLGPPCVWLWGAVPLKPWSVWLWRPPSLGPPWVWLWGAVPLKWCVWLPGGPPFRWLALTPLDLGLDLGAARAWAELQSEDAEERESAHAGHWSTPGCLQC